MNKNTKSQIYINVIYLLEYYNLQEIIDYDYNLPRLGHLKLTLNIQYKTKKYKHINEVH